MFDISQIIGMQILLVALVIWSVRLGLLIKIVSINAGDID